MTQEEKRLLLKDLCARLPYLENWVQYEGKDYIVTGYGHGRVSLLPCLFSSGVGPCPLIEEVKPYLRPMSSMTMEEREYYREAFNKDFAILEEGLDAPIAYTYPDGTTVRDKPIFNEIDWLNEHHFDYRGLIPMGLALEAPEGMYE